jgi:hypothetical protein
MVPWKEIQSKKIFQNHGWGTQKEGNHKSSRLAPIEQNEAFLVSAQNFSDPRNKRIPVYCFQNNVINKTFPKYACYLLEEQT